MGRIVAVDYGKARIGLAITDENKKLALPYKTISSGKTLSISAKNILIELSSYISNIEGFILGLPLKLSGEKGEMAKEIERLKEELSKITDKPITFFDERLTSAQADKSMKEIKISRKKRAERSDPVAAMIMLQCYLELKNC